MQAQVDAPFGIHLRRPERHPVVLCLPRQIVLREVGTVDRRIGIGADHCHGALVPFPSEHVGGGEAGGAATNDDHRRWHLPGLRLSQRPPGLRQSLPHEHHRILAFHAPTPNRIKRWSAQGFTCSQAETRVMQRTAHGVIHDQSVDERTVIVRAAGANSKPVIARPREQDIVVSHTSEQHATGCDGVHRDALRQVRSGGLFRISHARPPVDPGAIAASGLGPHEGRIDDVLRHEPDLQFVASNDIGHDQIVCAIVAALGRDPRHGTCFLEHDLVRVK